MSDPLIQRGIDRERAARSGGREISDRRPPDVLIIHWCPECGMGQVGTALPSWHGVRCDAPPAVSLTYVLASDPPRRDSHD
jgi:hypothetical protein